MKFSIALAALLVTALIAASTENAGAVVYCQYVALSRRLRCDARRRTAAAAGRARCSARSGASRNADKSRRSG